MPYKINKNKLDKYWGPREARGFVGRAEAQVA